MSANEVDEGVMRLSSGRVLHANLGYVGINNVLEVSAGFDDCLDGLTWCGGDDWTAEEKRELSDHMIGLWTRFKERFG